MTQSVSESTDPTMTLSEVRSWWEVPCIAHFCHTFSESLEFPLFEIEEFESALLPSDSNDTTGCEQVHPLIVDIHIAFLKGILEKKEIGVDNWELLLKLHFVWRCEFLNEKYNPMEHLAYSQIHTRTKVEILHRLCHWRLELDDVTDCLKCVDPQEMRLEEVGADRRGSRYWYFYGMRLYRESKEAQQYNKRYKSSSSLRSHREMGTPSSSSGSKKQPLTPRTPSTAKSRVKKNVLPKGDTSDVDSCTSGEDSLRVDGSKRVTRSSRQKALPNETHGSQDTSRQTDSSSPVTEGSALPPRTREQTPAVGENEFSSRTGWSVVCDSLKDWRELVSSLEESPHSCEVELCDCVRDELLPSLSQIDADRSLIPFAPTVAMEGDTSRRTSERLHKKMKPSYMSEQLSFMGVPEHPRKSRQSPECAGGCEASEKSEESDESDSFDSEMEEERKREREMEREKRDQEWKEAYSGNIQGPRKKAASSLVTDLEEEMTEEELRIAMLKLVDELKKHTDCWPFVDPVTDAIAPGYHDVIKRPMDVLSVEKKLKNEEYSTKEQFAKDFRRIFKNCRRYNGADNEYTEMADTIRLHFNKLFVKFFSQPSISGRRLRSPISRIGSSSDSEAEQGASLVLPRTPVGVKKRRKRRTAEIGERDDGVKISPSKRNKPGIRESKESGFANYPPFYPPYGPYPPYHQDKDSSSMYPPFPHEFPPFSYFPPFLSNPHPPYPSFPPYWAQRSHRHEDKHRCREVSSGGPGSTKERREEEAKLQNVIHSQGLLAKHKRDRVSSTTAEQSSLSSPESATPVNGASADPHRGAREDGRKGSIESRASSSSSMGAAFPPHIPRPHYGHLPPRPYHGGYYPPHYMDYMMDPYLHPPQPSFYERPAQPLPPLPAPRHPASRTEQRETTEEQGPASSKELTQVPVAGKVSEEGAACGEQRQDKQTENNQEDPVNNPSPDQLPALAESNISPPAQTKTAGGSETVEEQPHSTTEEADTKMYSHPPQREMVPIPPPSPSPTKRSKFSRPSPQPPYPYPPMPYPYYSPSPYAPHGYSHPPYDPYFAADMMTWQQQQHALQGMNSSKKRIARTPSMEHKYYKSPSDFSRGLPPYPGAPSSPEDFPSPYFYSSPSHLSKQRKHKPYCETDVLPPPTAYSLQESASAEDPPNVPDYKESLADYALHLAGGSKTASGEEMEASGLKPEPSPEEAAEVNSHPPGPLNEDPLPLSFPFTTPFLNGMQASTPEAGEELVQDLQNINSNNNNNNNSNNNNNLIDFPNLEPHAFSLPYVPLSPTRSPPPSYSHFMQRRHASFRPNTFGSFFLPSATSMPLLPPVHAAPSHRPDLKLDLIKQKQAQLNEWVARVNSQSHGRYAHLKQAGPEVPAGHSQINSFSPTVPNDRSEI